MGKRSHAPPADLQNYVTSPLKKIRATRKRKVSNHGNIGTPLRPAKASRTETDEDDEDESSSNDAHIHNCSTKQASSILLNSSLKIHGAEQSSPATNESPRPVYSLRPSVVNGTILHDLKRKPWRLGNPIGKGNFGEIFLASDNITIPVTNDNAKYVVKIEPHSNGPLFVEIHCILNAAKANQNNVTSSNDVKLEEEVSTKIPSGPPSGIPGYIASGSHYFGDARYRFLVLQRFDQDLHSLIKHSSVSQKSLLTLAIQVINVLENLHDKGYCHNDVKSQNLMISKCKYFKKNSTDTKSVSVKSKYEDNYDEKQPTTDSGNSSEQEANDDDDYDEEADFRIKCRNHYNHDIEDDEDFNDGTTTSNSNSNSMDVYKTPVGISKQRRGGNRAAVQYSGSNPVRSCRRQQRPNSIYAEMVNSHYLRPSKRISYSEFFADDGAQVKGDVDGDSRDTNFNSTDDDSIGFVPNSVRRRCTTTNSSVNKKSNNARRSANTKKKSPCKRLTRRQEKLLLEKQQKSNPLGHFQSVAAVAQPTVTIDPVETEHIFLIDFGLASKYIDNGVHRPFVMDQRRAHDGTLEFTSRDAHMGAHSRRSDLECLGYNLLFWSQGFLPWKEAAAQQQQEKVHRAKEYLMTDVREMLKQIYGKDVPKCLGEFLHLVGQLAYHERPHYSRYRRLFEREYQQLGYSLENMCLDSQEIARTCVRIKKDHGAGKHDFFELNNKLVNNSVLSIMKSNGTPFQDRGSLGDRVSPKNLRSKSDKKATRKKKFCWAEVLSQDPDQIARERAEKEFDREINDEEDRPPRRYEGKPTYAILELLRKYGEEKGSVGKESNSDKEENVIDKNYADKEEDDEDEGDEENEQEEDEDVVDVSDTSEEEEDDDEEDQEEEKDEDFGMDKHGDRNETSSEDEEDTDNNENEDTDSSESYISSQEYHRKCGRRVSRPALQSKAKSNRRETAVPTANSRSSKKSKTSSLSNNIVTTKRSEKERKGTTRKRNCVKTSSPLPEVIKVSKQKSRRNGRKNSSKQTSAASAAGEQQAEKQVLAQYLFSERPKRRCPIKTDTSEMLNGRNRRLLGTEDDSNSNFSPDVRILFNIWNKMSNENIYAKSAATTAPTTKVATPANGGMVTRHYRK